MIATATDTEVMTHGKLTQAKLDALKPGATVYVYDWTDGFCSEIGTATVAVVTKLPRESFHSVVTTCGRVLRLGLVHLTKDAAVRERAKTMTHDEADAVKNLETLRAARERFQAAGEWPPV